MLEEGSFMATGGLVGVAVSHLPRFHGVAFQKASPTVSHQDAGPLELLKILRAPKK